MLYRTVKTFAFRSAQNLPDILDLVADDYADGPGVWALPCRHRIAAAAGGPAVRSASRYGASFYDTLDAV